MVHNSITHTDEANRHVHQPALLLLYPSSTGSTCTMNDDIVGAFVG
jgi:hypothetical protein